MLHADNVMPVLLSLLCTSEICKPIRSSAQTSNGLKEPTPTINVWLRQKLVSKEKYCQRILMGKKAIRGTKRKKKAWRAKIYADLDLQAGFL